PYIIWLFKVDTDNSVVLPSPTANEVIITTSQIPGLEIHIPAGALIHDTEGNIVTTLSITAIPPSRPPFPMPQVEFPVYFMLQPTVARIIPPARVIYPNCTQERPGSRADYWHYDLDKGWYLYGRGTVAADGRKIIPDTGVGIY